MNTEHTRPIGVSQTIPDVSGLYERIAALVKARAYTLEQTRRAIAALEKAHARIVQLEETIARGIGPTAAELRVRTRIATDAKTRAEKTREVAARLILEAQTETESTREENDDFRGQLIIAHEYATGLQRRLDEHAARRFWRR